MNNILSLIDRENELFSADINNYEDILRATVSSSSFLITGGAGSIDQTANGISYTALCWNG